jgi:hypothetical protein
VCNATEAVWLQLFVWRSADVRIGEPPWWRKLYSVHYKDGGVEGTVEKKELGRQAGGSARLVGLGFVKGPFDYLSQFRVSQSQFHQVRVRFTWIDHNYTGNKRAGLKKFLFIIRKNPSCDGGEGGFPHASIHFERSMHPMYVYTYICKSRYSNVSSSPSTTHFLS